MGVLNQTMVRVEPHIRTLWNTPNSWTIISDDVLVSDSEGHAHRITGRYKLGDLDRDWQVDAEGNVTPSLLCGRCGWHVFAKLEGWGGDV